MGGRGAGFTVIKRLPNYKSAVIKRDKLKNYILNPSKDKNKAQFFSGLGFNMKNYAQFEKQVLAKLRTNKALEYATDENGNTAYQVNMLLGINKKAMVTTAWIIKSGSNVPTFVTAYPNRKLKRKKGTK